MSKEGHATVYIDNKVYENIPVIDNTIVLPLEASKAQQVHIVSGGHMKHLALLASLSTATAVATFGERLIYDEPKDYKPSKGKKNKFDRLNAIYSGQRNKRK